MNKEKTMILNMVKEGKISVEEAESLLDALGGSEESTQTRTEKEDLKFDLEGMKAGLKSGMKEFAKSMQGTIKTVTEELKNLDIGNVVSSAFGKFKASAEKELILSAADVKRLDIKTGSGDFVVTGGETGDIIVQAVVTVRGADEDDAKMRADEMELIHSLEEGTLKIKDSGTAKNLTGPYSVDYKITAPTDMDLNIQTMDGDISVKTINGDVKLNTYSGDIHLKSCGTSIHANTKSGDIDVEDCSGTLNVKSLSGDLSIKDIESKDLSCNTLSGDIVISARPETGSSINAKTLSGDVNLRVPADSEFAINADTLSGSVDCALPVRDGQRKGQKYTAILNEPTGALNASTKSGDISLSALDESENVSTEDAEVVEIEENTDSVD